MKSRAIITLGMHRSGTSAFTGLLNLLGVDLGPNLMPASADNESGYWEHLDIVNLHDQLLATLDSRWDDVSRLPEGWWRGDAIQPFRAHLKEILLRDFGSSPLWSLKDPRMCRLLPLWSPLLAELEVTPIWVLMTRHPFENIGSLDRRDGFSWGKSELLWLQHTLDAEYHTRGGARVVVTFEQFLDDWIGTLARIEPALGSAWPVAPESCAERIANYLDPGKRHHRAMDLDRLSPWSRQAYEALLAGADGRHEEMRSSLDEVRTAFETADALYRPVLRGRAEELEKQLATETARFAELSEALRELRAKHAETREKLATKSADLDARKQQLKQLERSPGAKLNRALARFKKPASEGVEPVHFPAAPANPEVSIIASIGSGLERAAASLGAVREGTDAAKFELLATGSNTATAQLRGWQNIEIIPGGKTGNFAERHKRAAQKARGTYLVFLADRVCPEPGWLEALIEPLRAMPEGGVTGAEAGLIRRDGSIEMLPTEAGGDLRPADFCTTACLAIPRHLFFQVGGFDGYYLPVEEAAFGLKIRRGKHPVLQQPRCRLTQNGPPDAVDPERFRTDWERFARRCPDMIESLP